ncbi:hypothetical protein [Vibrio natriegens]|uniref:hypothetical protein n=1 Tax=Vibrio natriegens TaxID=691 RepID=UPI001FBC0443|nr:hypothetical protein [Vibrio natriegens]
MDKSTTLADSFLKNIVERFELEPAQSTNYPDLLVELGAEVALIEVPENLRDYLDDICNPRTCIESHAVEPLLEIFIGELPSTLRYLIWLDIPCSDQTIKSICESRFQDVEHAISEDDIRRDISEHTIGKLREISVTKLVEYLNFSRLPKQMTEDRQLAQDIYCTLEELTSNYFNKPNWYYITDAIKGLDLEKETLKQLRPIVQMIAEEAVHATLSGLAGEFALGSQTQRYHLLDSNGRKVHNLANHLVEIIEENEKARSE